MPPIRTQANPKVITVGAGFGGLYAARSLAHLPVQLTVLDRKNHYTFQPLLYQVATAGLSPGDISAPIRWVLRGARNAEVLLANVTGFDLERREVIADDLRLSYDYLVVATGAMHAYFGHPEWEKRAPGLKTLEDALEIRNRVLLAFEVAERQAAVTRQHEPLAFVVVGGGPTGVELAGTLAEITRTALAQDFRNIDPKRTRILLLEGGPRILPAYAEDLSREAQQQLQKLGVEVRTSTVVTGVEPHAVRIGNSMLPATVTLWAAGVAASPLGRALGAEVDRAGRVFVQPDLSLPGHPEVFVIGDLAAFRAENGEMLPGVAPVAIQEGKAVAQNIKRDLAGKGRKNFHYLDKGSLATIGRAAAVAQFGKIHISGFLAWLSWLFVHIFFLIGFRNRFVVMFQWAWSYFTFERGVRLITGNPEVATRATPAATDISTSKPHSPSKMP
jgi:NADH:ubiquinone reductase (H+-translocating)